MRTWSTPLLALALALGAVGCNGTEMASPDGMGDRPNGFACSANNECVSGVCNAGACQSTANGMGRSNGAVCATMADCASAFCVNGVCQSTPNGTGRASGTPCSGNGECASNVCASGVCQSSAGSMGRGNGMACAMASDCGSGVCGGGVCQGRVGASGRSDGSMCTNASECASANCTGGVCAPPVSGPTGRPNGSTCVNAADCRSGFCVANVCQGSPAGTGRPNGTTCASPAECAGGFCVAGVCSSSMSMTGRPVGSMCTTGAECATGLCLDGVCRNASDIDGGMMDASGDRTDARNDRPDRTDAADDSDDLRPDSSVTGEICRNGFDDNMNGQVDEGCECYVGQRQFCYTGNPALAGVGTCAFGTQMCTGPGGAQTVGSWTPCMGSVAPGTETCDMMDNDCDREVDETCACTAGATRSCFAGPPGTLNIGVCRAGTQRCLPSGTWGSCAEQFLPVIERCDRIDNDCDGMIDEGCNCVIGSIRTCFPGAMGTAGVGICQPGSQMCTANPDGTSDWGRCSGAITPETSDPCDGRDNNCNGMIDESCSCTPGMSRSCFNGPPEAAGVGVCHPGIITCLSSGRWSACTGAVNPSAESCNMLDDDCDGEVDADWCQCPAGQTLRYYRRDFDMRGDRSMVAPGDNRPTLLPICEPMTCSPGQVSVEVRPDMYRCVPPPPSCPPDLFPYYTQGGSWRCERGCEVLITYGHLYDGLVVCAPRPDITCGPGQTPHYAFESEVWECRPMCDNGQYDIHMLGSLVICIPC